VAPALSATCVVVDTTVLLYTEDERDGSTPHRHSRRERVVGVGHERFSFWDAMVVEAALLSGATTLLSEDLQDGHAIGGLTIRNPFAQK
jgi:predicted nucleic acid-binding protein